MKKLEDLIGKKMDVGVIVPNEDGYIKGGFTGVVSAIEGTLVLFTEVIDDPVSEKSDGSNELWLNTASLSFVGMSEI